MCSQVVSSDVSVESFDLEAIIVAFLRNTENDFVELPRLSTGQRKQAKRLVDQHAELVCESFGFGEERRLHLFKKDSHVVRPRAAKTESTEKISLGEAVALETEAVRCSTGTALQDAAARESCDSKPMLPTCKVQADPCDQTLVLPVSKSHWEDEQQVSTPTSASDGNTQSCVSSPASSIPELPMHFNTIPMRNTFVHFENSSADERQVQSMPHGMFGQCLLADYLAEERMSLALASSQMESERTTDVGSVLPELPSSVLPVDCATLETLGEASLSPGTEVVIQGLMRLPAFNGLSGVVQSFDSDTGRYSVLLSSQVCGHQWAKVKRDNLRCTVPPPPPYAPALQLDFCDSDTSCHFALPNTPTWYEDVTTASHLVLTALV